MAMTVGERIRGWLGIVAIPNSGWRINQTERVLALLLKSAVFGIAVIIVYAVLVGLSEMMDGASFLVWGLFTALAAWLVGAILGLLFGLPSVEVRISRSTTGVVGDDSAATLGYRESTNLEQVADWVTKILIGLTLTQYFWWEQAFERAFSRISAQMLACRPAEGCLGMDAAPAAVLAIFFAADGFLMSYLVMRRYFITEMVKGKAEAGEVAAARQAGLLQENSVTSSPQTSRSDAVAMARIAASLAPLESVKKANEIVRDVSDKIEFPDDPWRGLFGGKNVAGECRLEATVGPLPGSTELFNVRLVLSAAKGANRVGQTATFYLHPTFGKDPKKVAFGQDGTAALDLIAYGAFTVGVMLETGEPLELNLATLNDAPELFKLR